MTWYSVYKTFRGGTSKTSYFEVPSFTSKDIVKEYAEEWAEHSFGGHNYGWTVYWKKIRRPPKKWLRSKIKEFEECSKQYKQRAIELKTLLNKY